MPSSGSIELHSDCCKNPFPAELDGVDVVGPALAAAVVVVVVDAAAAVSNLVVADDLDTTQMCCRRRHRHRHQRRRRPVQIRDPQSYPAAWKKSQSCSDSSRMDWY